jgi:hypothetical protein
LQNSLSESALKAIVFEEGPDPGRSISTIGHASTLELWPGSVRGVDACQPEQNDIGFLPFTIEDVNAIPQPLPGGYADVTRGGGMTFERVVFLGPDHKPRRTSPQEGARKEAGTVSHCFPRQSANHDMIEAGPGNIAHLQTEDVVYPLAYDFVQIVW